jgi:poly(A) polymerase
MEKFLALEAPSEAEEGMRFRAEICDKIQKLAIEWLGNPTDLGLKPRLIPFGSTLLGVLTKDSDVDTVLVLPASVSREQVFQQFVKRLNQSGISNCISAIPDAHVPVIKLVAGDTLDVDILTAHVPSDLLRQINSLGERALLSLSSKIFDELDTPSLLSLNGVRVGQIILQLVRSLWITQNDFSKIMISNHKIEILHP